MPTRLVDGNALWKSAKLKRVSRRFRAEYANLIPLAEANGSFDADPVKIWVDVYAFNREDVTVDTVVRILDEFEKSDMLIRWSDGTKTWGYWKGIEKTGRLPTGVHLTRYKNLPPDPPPGAIRDNPGTVTEKPGVIPEGLVGFGSGLVGFGEDPQNLGEKQMATRKQFRNVILRAGLIPDPPMSPSWPVLDEMVAAFEGSDVLQIFEDWVGNRVGETRFPVSLFVRDLPTLVQTPGLKTSCKELDNLADELYKIAGVCFTGKDLTALGSMREEFTDKEITISWKQFINDEASTYPTNWPRKFVTGGGATIIRVFRKKIIQDEKDKLASEAAIEQMRVEDARVRAAREAEAAQEASDLDILMSELENEKNAGKRLQ